ncbi:MAG: hypothetical protein JWN17_727 [Frankiales bacterium]|nr:hypothetical protein [Frankiales bacterium]
MRPTLSLVQVVPAPREQDESLPLTVPVAGAGETPWRSEGETTWVPAALLLAAAGRCSCDDCCAVLARTKARRQLAAV